MDKVIKKRIGRPPKTKESVKKRLKQKGKGKFVDTQSPSQDPTASAVSGQASHSGRLPALNVQREESILDRLAPLTSTSASRSGAPPNDGAAPPINTASLSLLADCVARLEKAATPTRSTAAAASTSAVAAPTSDVAPPSTWATVAPLVKLAPSSNGQRNSASTGLPVPGTASKISTPSPATPTRAALPAVPLPNPPAPSSSDSHVSFSNGLATPGLLSAIPAPTPKTPTRAAPRIDHVVFPSIDTDAQNNGHILSSNGLPTPNATPIKPTNGSQSFILKQEHVWLKRRVEELEEDEDDDDEVERRLVKRPKVHDDRNLRLPGRNGTRERAPSSSGLPTPHAMPTKPSSGCQMFGPEGEPARAKRRAEELEEGEVVEEGPLVKRRRVDYYSERAGRTRAWVLPLGCIRVRRRP